MRATIPKIPYFKTSRYRVETMIQLANIKPDEKAADLGSGDGRILIALAQAGADVTGFELDPDMIMLSHTNIQTTNLQTKIKVLQKDFWQENLSEFNIVTIYPMPDIMKNLEQKLYSELKPGSRILVNYYPFANHKPTKVKNQIYLYNF